MMPAADIGVRAGAARPARVVAGVRATPLLIIAAMAIPIALAPLFLAQSLRLDEAQSLWQTSRGILAIFSAVAGDVHVPLYHLLLHGWRLYVADGVVGARLLSLSFFVASVPMVYLLGARAYGARVGRYAMFLFALSPFMNWYGSEIRMYTMFVFFTVANQYFFLRIFKDARPSRLVWWGYAATALCGVFTHYFFFLNLAAQVVFYFLRRPLFPRGALSKFVATAGVIIALIEPWLWYVYRLGTASYQEPALTAPTSVNFFSAFSEFLFGFQSDALNTIFLSLWPLAIIAGILALGHNQRISRETEYFGLTLILSFAGAFAVSFLVTPVFVSRYLIFTVPAFYLILASLISTYRPKRRFLPAAGLLLLVMLTLGNEIVSAKTPVKENYAEAAAYLSSHATAQDAILLSAPFTIYPIQYYYRGPAVVSTLPAWNQFAHGAIPTYSDAALPTDVAAATMGDQNVYLVLSYDQGYEDKIKQYFDSHYAKIAEEPFSNDLTVYVYRLRYNTEKSAIGVALP